MKKLLLNIITLVAFSFGLSAQNVNIPDANFKNLLIANTTINSNSDDEIQVNEAAAFTGTIACANKSISSLAGIEAFINITKLDCSFNTIGALNVSQNSALTELKLTNNDLTSLDVSQNTNLTTLFCNYNNFSSIDLTHNTALEKLYCNGNNLTTLDLSQLTALEILFCGENDLTSFDVSNNTALTLIHCESAFGIGNLSTITFGQNVNLSNISAWASGITELDVTSLTGLKYLSLNECNLSSIDLSQNLALKNVNFAYNPLVTIDLSHNTALDYANCQHNTNLTSANLKNLDPSSFGFYAQSSTNLSCIEVDDIAAATAGWTNIEAAASFSLNCSGSGPIVNIPDANFKNLLIANTTINSNSDDEIQVNEAAAFTGTIACANKSISSLAGIEAFINITKLECSFNTIGALNVSQNSALTELKLTNNDLTSLDVSQNTNLTFLNCQDNNLTNLDLSNNTHLTELNCEENNLATLNITQCTALTEVNCADNNLSTLDISQNIALTFIGCNSNNLTVLNMKNISTSILTEFYATENPDLTCIDVDDVTAATAAWTNIDPQTNFSLNCSGSGPIVNIPDANFKNYLVGNTAINTNMDGEIQVSEATAFSGTINCGNLNISDLTGIEAFTSLTILQANSNNLSSLDVSQNTNLYRLICPDNNLTSLDISNIPYLDLLSCPDNALTSLNVANNNNTNFIGFVTSNNPNLTCIQVDDVAWSNANWVIDATASFSLDCNSVLVTSIIVQGQSGASTISTLGGILQMEADVFPANANDGSYTWSVADGTGSATISASGVLTALTNGMVIVTATANDPSGVSGNKVISISNQTSNTHDQKISQQISIFPNPAISEITIDTELNIDAITIIDIMGKTIKTIKDSNYTVDISDLSSGVYFLKIQLDQVTVSKKIIKK